MFCCETCSFETSNRIVMMTHAAALGHPDWAEELPEDYLSAGERVFLTTEAAEREAKAAIWDEGYEAGGRDENSYGVYTPNPYRMEDES